MSLEITIQKHLRERQMLKHPFYQDWMAGRLSIEQLQYYAIQYRPFVDSFPCFVSAIHSLCGIPQARLLLLENLMDEEGVRNSAPHPQLWRDFAKGLGVINIDAEPLSEAALELERIFFTLCRSSYEEGLCALYAYESQIPEIAKAKIVGLAQHYGLSDSDSNQFFLVHQEADLYHSRACEELIRRIDVDKHDCAMLAAETASKALWNFLTEVHQ